MTFRGRSSGKGAWGAGALPLASAMAAAAPFSGNGFGGHSWVWATCKWERYLSCSVSATGVRAARSPFSPATPLTPVVV